MENNSHTRKKRKHGQVVQLRCLGCRRKAPFQGQYNESIGRISSKGLMQHLRATLRPDWKKEPCFSVGYSSFFNSPDDIDFTSSCVAENHATVLEDDDVISDIRSCNTPFEAAPHFEAADKEIDEKTEFGLLRKSNLLEDSEKFVSKNLFSDYSFPVCQLKSEEINSQTCPSKLPPRVSEEGRKNFVISRLNDNLEMDTEDGREEISVDEDASDYSIDTDRGEGDGDLVLEVEVGSQFGANYLPRDIGIPATTNVHPNNPQPQQSPNGGNNHGFYTIPNLDSPNYLLDRLQREEHNRAGMPRTMSARMDADLHLLSLARKHGWSAAAVVDIQKWAHNAAKKQKDIFLFDPTTRSEMFTQFRLGLGVEKANAFQEHMIDWLPDNRPTSLFVRPFLDCVYELLTNEEVTGPNGENISLPHPTNPFKPRPDHELPYVSSLKRRRNN